MKKRKFLKSFVLILVFTMLISGCAPKKQEVGENNSGKDQEAKKDTLNFGLVAEPTTLDPLTSSERITFVPVMATHDALIDEDEDGNLSPLIAEKWDMSDDGLDYTFTIREDVKFHNGETLTMEDVIFTLDILLENRAHAFGFINNIEELSDTEFKISLDYPFSSMLFLLSKPYAGIVHKDTYLEDPEGYGRNPNGSGAFKFVEWVSGDRIELVRNEDYWREPAPIKNLNFKIITDESTELIALQTGEIDAYFQVSLNNKSIILDDENLEWYETPGLQVITLGFNNGKKSNGEDSIFADNKALRQAVAYAINKEDLVIGATEDSVPPLYTPFPKTVINYPENFDGNIYNLEKAKEKLVEAGYPDGLTLKLKVATTPQYSKPAEVIEGQLSQIGITVEVEQMERGAYMEEVYNNFDYDATVWAVSCDYPDADDGAYRRYYSGMISPANNYMQVNDPVLDEAIMKNRTSTNNDDKADAVLKYAEIIRDEVYGLPLYSSLNTLAYNKDLKGVNMDGSQKIDFYEWSWTE